MLNFDFKYENYFMDFGGCSIYTLPNARMSEQAGEFAAAIGNICVSGTIETNEPSVLHKFAEILPFICCKIEGNRLLYKYLQPANGVIEFIESPQEQNTINIRIADYLWMDEVSKQHLFIPEVKEVTEISRVDNYTWLIDIVHTPNDNVYDKLKRCWYVKEIYECNTYITPDEERSMFTVYNTAQLPFQKIYEPVGVSFGKNISVYPISQLKKVYGESAWA